MILYKICVIQLEMYIKAEHEYYIAILRNIFFFVKLSKY